MPTKSPFLSAHHLPTVEVPTISLRELCRLCRFAEIDPVCLTDFSSFKPGPRHNYQPVLLHLGTPLTNEALRQAMTSRMYNAAGTAQLLSLALNAPQVLRDYPVIIAPAAYWSDGVTLRYFLKIYTTPTGRIALGACAGRVADVWDSPNAYFLGTLPA